MCPYCDSSNVTLKFTGVKDWYFNSAPGIWNYLDCNSCGSIFIDPFPDANILEMAYSKYYTHGNKNNNFLSGLKLWLKQLTLSRLYIETSNKDNKSYPIRLFDLFLNFCDKKINWFFGFREIASMPRGKLLDVGCGDGSSLATAVKMGWCGIGLEVDQLAANCAMTKGLDIIIGDYTLIKNYIECFDCVICSHVLEHLDKPLEALNIIANSLKTGGYMFLSLPNSESFLAMSYGKYWRGLECPRHLSIPSARILKKILEEIGFNVTQKNSLKIYTLDESWRIMKNYKKISMMDRLKFMRLKFCRTGINSNNSDFIEFICIKK
jgi:2-polyprenyl-3-methyl-5-hydroxy-6-metoxy-1,4-benzoquinol methylase